jgi:hypothetical protein
MLATWDLYFSLIFVHNSGTVGVSLLNRNQDPTLRMNTVNSNQAASCNIVCLNIDYPFGILTDFAHCDSKQVFCITLNWTVRSYTYLIEKLLNGKVTGLKRIAETEHCSQLGTSPDGSEGRGCNSQADLRRSWLRLLAAFPSHSSSILGYVKLGHEISLAHLLRYIIHWCSRSALLNVWLNVCVESLRLLVDHRNIQPPCLQIPVSISNAQTGLNKHNYNYNGDSVTLMSTADSLLTVQNGCS